MTSKDKEPLVCTVNRKTWARGKKGDIDGGIDTDAGLLVNANGSKCCLGFLGCQLDIPVEKLRLPMPNLLSPEDFDKYPILSHGNWYSFAEINDDSIMSDEQREELLQELAEKNGFRFRFTGK
jgi:hypothetical protein